MAPTTYDPTSPDEQPVALPSAPLVQLTPNVVLQPPLSRRGTGPGIILILPDANTQVSPRRDEGLPKPLDPEPVMKWAEEGFAVVGITTSESESEAEAEGDENGGSEVLGENLKVALDALEALEAVDVKGKFAVIVYDPSQIFTISKLATAHPSIVALVGYGSFASPASTLPTLLHLTANAPRPRDPPSTTTTIHTYELTSASSAHFVLPQSATYDPGSAALAHSRTLVFLRKWLGGPFFDIEAIWDEHTYFEFAVRSVAKTMGTMVAEPYVNHVPTMTGGIGREALTAFYRDHFIFQNPDDVRLQVVSRTVGPDRVVDEFVTHLTHDRVIDWLLPSVPATGKKLAIPMIAVVNVRGDRLYHEHIWWDQATALRQAGILPSHLPFSNDATGVTGSLRLPVAGAESADMLIDESKGRSNEMFGPEWGLTK